jgi:protein TonB
MQTQLDLAHFWSLGDFVIRAVAILLLLFSVASWSAPAAVTDARFDAAYLGNPEPVYPIASRRLGEEGKVRLRVKVRADGTAERVEISQSSGFDRLDEAARAAVERWRFIPARRGEDAIESWVIVLVRFSLQDR